MIRIFLDGVPTNICLHVAEFRVWLGDLPHDLSEQRMWAEFSAFGPVLYVYVMRLCSCFNYTIDRAAERAREMDCDLVMVY